MVSIDHWTTTFHEMYARDSILRSVGIDERWLAFDGKWTERQLLLAFCMGTHPRLGGECLLPNDCITLIVEHLKLVSSVTMNKLLGWVTGTIDNTDSGYKVLPNGKDTHVLIYKTKKVTFRNHIMRVVVTRDGVSFPDRNGGEEVTFYEDSTRIVLLSRLEIFSNVHST